MSTFIGVKGKPKRKRGCVAKGKRKGSCYDTCKEPGFSSSVSKMAKEEEETLKLQEV